MADLRALRTEMRRRTKVIRELAEADDPRCPENKVTPELAADKRLGLHPIVIAVDECQVLFEHPVYGAEVETICTDLAKRGPALGIMLMLATQRPDAKSIPTGISANAVLRMCLKVMGQTENDMVLGTSAYKNGDPGHHVQLGRQGRLLLRRRGQGPADRPRLRVRPARRPRRSPPAPGPCASTPAGITGYALGQDHDGTPARRLVDDVLTVFGDAKALWCETIAERLAGSLRRGLRRHHAGRRGQPAARPGGQRARRPRDRAQRRRPALGLPPGRARAPRRRRRCVAQAPRDVAEAQRAGPAQTPGRRNSRYKPAAR